MEGVIHGQIPGLSKTRPAHRACPDGSSRVEVTQVEGSVAGTEEAESPLEAATDVAVEGTEGALRVGAAGVFNPAAGSWSLPQAPSRRLNEASRRSRCMIWSSGCVRSVR